MQNGETDKTFLFTFFFLWLYIAAFGGIAFSHFKGLRSTSDQDKLLPEVFFDQLDTPYLDAEGKAKFKDSFTVVDRNGRVTQMRKK